MAEFVGRPGSQEIDLPPLVDDLMGFNDKWIRWRRRRRGLTRHPLSPTMRQCFIDQVFVRHGLDPTTEHSQLLARGVAIISDSVTAESGTAVLNSSLFGHEWGCPPDILYLQACRQFADFFGARHESWGQEAAQLAHEHAKSILTLADYLMQHV